MIPLATFSAWLARGERGRSSDAIVARLTGEPIGPPYDRRGRDYPHDPADFRRCELLLRTYVVARLEFPAMRDVSPEWARLVDHWDEIHATIEAEVPGYLDGKAPGDRRAPNGYALMRRVIDGAA